MTNSIYNNAGMPSGQGAAPEIPEDLRKDHAQILRMRAKGVTLPWFGNDKQRELIERIAALTLERDTLKAERDDALRKSSRGVWRCFHCDEIFDTPGGARDHFGAAQGDTPGCLLKVQLGDERGWLMELRKEQEASEQQLQRALNAEREVETLECRVASLSSDMKTIKPFAKCDSMRDVFNVYDSMEGRALAAEEQVGALEAEIKEWKHSLESVALMAGMGASESWGTLDILTHVREMREETAALKAKVERLSAPVSDVVKAISKMIRAYAVEGGEPDYKEYPADTCEELLVRIGVLIAARASTPPTTNPISDDGPDECEGCDKPLRDDEGHETDDMVMLCDECWQGCADDQDCHSEECPCEACAAKIGTMKHPISDDEQRRKDAAWNDRPKARCICGEIIAWYSGEWLHVAGRSGLCADGRLASPAHFLVGMPPAEPEWQKEA